MPDDPVSLIQYSPTAVEQRGSLNLMRYPGQSILIYPAPSVLQVPIAQLFAEPIEVLLDYIGRKSAVHIRLNADKRLVMVRKEIYARNGHSFEPAPSRREDAFRRAFVRAAKDQLDPAVFDLISCHAWNVVLEPNPLAQSI